MGLREHKKQKIEDREFFDEVRKEDHSRKELVRVYAVNVAFVDVNFAQCDFSSCYFRRCRFIRCDFTGANIRGTNLSGSQFDDCIFKYTTWEKTLLDDAFLDSCLPSELNLARDLVRCLRVNYSQIGNYDAVNRAASIEVKLTGQHLYNAAYSGQAYYRAKYKGFSQFTHGLHHAQWKALDLLWGNGESVIRVAISGLMVVLVASGLVFGSRSNLPFPEAFWMAFCTFLGVRYGQELSLGYTASLTIGRFVLFGLFMAILVKRLSRR
jgi:hypothetical protein